MAPFVSDADVPATREINDSVRRLFTGGVPSAMRIGEHSMRAEWWRHVPWQRSCMRTIVSVCVGTDPHTINRAIARMCARS